MQNLKHLQGQTGFTLTELMIAVALGMSVISSVLLGYLATYSGSISTLANSKLGQEMTALMNIMVEDIRRAGYNNAVTPPAANPFNQLGTTALAIFDTVLLNGQQLPDTGAGECILYAYDRNAPGAGGTAGVVDPEELFGFRRLPSGVVEMRTGGVPANAPTCNVAAQWTELTDPSFMTVSVLNFSHAGSATLAGSACLNSREPDAVDNDADGTIDNAQEFDCYNPPFPIAGSNDITVETRQVNITLTANLTNDPFVQMTMSQSVRVRNDMVRIR